MKKDLDLGNDCNSSPTRQGQNPAAELRKGFASGGCVQNPKKSRRDAGVTGKSYSSIGMSTPNMHQDESSRRSERVLQKAQMKAARGQKETEYPFVPMGKR